MANHALSPPETPASVADHQEIADLRFGMRMSPRLYKSLEMLSNKEGISKANIVRRSVGLYARATEAESEGKFIGFGCVNKGAGSKITELISLRSASLKDKNPDLSEKSVGNEPFVRYEMRVSSAFLDRLEQMSNEEGITKADIIRRALGLYSLASEAEAKEQLVIFAKLNEDNTVTIAEAIKLR